MMKYKTTKGSSLILLLLLVTTLLLAVPTPVMAQSGDDGDQVVLGGSYRLRSDETVEGDLIILGGTAVLEEDSHVRGNVLLTGGTLEVSGTIDGNITAFGGSVLLMEEALIKGDVILNSVTFSRSPDAVVQGDIRNNVINLESFDLGDLPSITVPEPDYTTPFQVWIDFLTGAIWWVLRILAVSGLAALVVLVAQKPTGRVAQSIGSQPLVSSAFGLLTAIVTPALLVLLTITIILIPVAIIGILALAVAGLFGWIAVGYEIGRRLEKALKQTWAPAITGGIGTFLLMITTSIFGLIPCIGWIIPVLVSIMGVGGVLISRFGTQVYGQNGSPKSQPFVIDAETTDSEPENAGEDNPSGQ